MADHKTNFEAALYKILKKLPDSRLPVDKACQRAVKRVYKKTAIDKNLLQAEAESFLAKSGRKGRIQVKKGTVRLAPSKVAHGASKVETPAEYDTAQTAKSEAVAQRPTKKRKLGSASNQAVAAGQASSPADTPQTCPVAVKGGKTKQEATDAPEEIPAGTRKKKKHKKVKEAEVPNAPEEVPERNRKHDKVTGEKRSKKSNAAGAAAVSKSNKGPTKRGRLKSEAAIAAEDQGEAMPQIGAEVDWMNSRARKDLIHGRFSELEKQALKNAAVGYAREKGLDEEDFSWLFNTRSNEQKELTRGAWKAIASEALPHRNIRAVWSCGTRLLHPGNYKGKWTDGEVKNLVALVEERGQKWTQIGNELGRLPSACRERYREETTKSEQTNQGKWTSEEDAALREAVEEYIATKQEYEAKPKAAELSLADVPSPQKVDPAEDARLVQDDVDWKVISAKVGTRTRTQCMNRWYRHMAPSMVSKGEWGMGDDRKLLKGLLLADARQVFLVPWDNLVEGRTAKQSKRRWGLMTKRVPGMYERTFTEQLDYLVDTFAPKLRQKVEAMRAQDSDES